MRSFFRLSHFEKSQEARHLARSRAAIVLGRQVLADNPRPDPPPPAQPKIKTTPAAGPNGGPMRLAIDRKAKVKNDRRQLERRHLSIANEHVAKAERLIREQTAILEKLDRDGHDTKLAEDTLRVFESNLQVMCEHRNLIIRAIEDTD